MSLSSFSNLYVLFLSLAFLQDNRVSNVLLYTSDNCKYPCFVLKLKEKFFIILLLSMTLTVGLLYIPFILLKMFFLIKDVLFWF